MKRAIGGPARRVRRSFRAAGLMLLAAGVLSAACDEKGTRSPPTSPLRGAPVASAAPANPVIDYQLTVANLDGLYLAHHELYRLSRTNPEPLERLQEELNEIEPDGIEKIVLAVVREPTVRDAMLRARISPRDFFLTQYNLVNAVFVLEARTTGRPADLPPVSERNIEFVQRHPQEVQRLMTERRPREP